MKYFYYKMNGREESEVEQALEEALAEYTSHWNRGGSDYIDKVAGRLLFLGLIQKKDWDAATIHLNSMMRRFPSDPNLIQLTKAIYSEGSDNPSKALQIFFDRSSESPFFQSEDTSLPDIEGTFEVPLEQP